MNLELVIFFELFYLPTISCFRSLDDKPLEESETVLYEHDEKANLYHLTLTHDIKGQSGTVKVVATNIGGEATASAKLTVDGRAPEFIENPLKCTILEGMILCHRTTTTNNNMTLCH